MAIKTQGTQFKRGNGASPEVFSVVGEVAGFDGPGGESSEIKTTHLLSAAQEYLIGLPDEGDLSFDCNLAPADAAQVGCRQDRVSQVARNFKIIFTDVSSTTMSFTAFVKGFRVTGQTDDAVRVKVSLRITGAVTWTP